MRLAPFASLVVASAALRSLPGEHGSAALLQASAASPLHRLAYPAQAVEGILLSSARRESLEWAAGGGVEEAGEDAVHVCVVAQGKIVTQELAELVRSVLYHRGALTPVFHVITDDWTSSRVREVFRNATWDRVHLVSFHAANVSKQLDELGVHWEAPGVAFFTKAFLWQFLPSVERCILLDTDMLLAAPLAELQGVFGTFGERHVMAAIWRGNARAGNKLNGGVVLHDFGKQRASGWPSAVRESHRAMVMAGSRQRPDGRLDVFFPDQMVLNGALMDYTNETDPTKQPGGLLALHPRWNTEMGQGFYGLCSTPPKISLGILHFNGGNTACLWMCKPKLEPYLPCMQRLVEEHALPAWPPCPN
mmetsp:Transcript_27217/g.84703  ORF Transcript_27217/g.84703 Transcript_27217/m.84703 type:complete len:363 (-) Transcript_27217:37-1125(-)|eukprot:CAMPEP_0204519688 /NCGR_PEP_ID=MMETSP0661-20131031/4857_1 /ASSEMBLY_ACC=CAM_ASM_000606 /TAXON_ID=109239 /ORGANISM="Alexandrium margalefi, Strain AMGDE01CS-322" /LENGTH=362 /DNA_ID=CAMNT_0051525199 /DNA_START=75 /DNA_END=1163 /DNA_ORIENTATION=+